MCFYWCMDSGFYQTGAWCMVSRLYASTIYWLMWRLFIYVLDKSRLDQILYNCMNYTTSTNKTCIHCAALHHLSPVQIKLESHGVQNRGSYCNLSAVLPRSLLFPQKTDGFNGFKTANKFVNRAWANLLAWRTLFPLPWLTTELTLSEQFYIHFCHFTTRIISTIALFDGYFGFLNKIHSK